jgi:pilus assembly protein Flp/PilA
LDDGGKQVTLFEGHARNVVRLPESDVPDNHLEESGTMKSIRKAVGNFISNEDGAALVEYALLVALIAIICILGVTFLGRKVSEKFKVIGDNLSST